MTIFISGPLCRKGHSNSFEFFNAEMKLVAAGYKVANPIKTIEDWECDHGYTTSRWVTAAAMIDASDAVYALPAHDKSLGPKRERAYAKQLGLPIYKSIDDIPSPYQKGAFYGRHNYSGS